MSPELILPRTTCRIRSLGDRRTVAERLTQMGILPGMQLEVVRTGPFGGTVAIALEHGELVALRTDEIAAMDCEILAAPLSSPIVQPGRRYRVAALDGSNGFLCKMTEVGIEPGTKLTVVSTDPVLVVEVAGAQVRLGHGEAGKIVVADHDPA